MNGHLVSHDFQLMEVLIWVLIANSLRVSIYSLFSHCHCLEVEKAKKRYAELSKA